MHVWVRIDATKCKPFHVKIYILRHSVCLYINVITIKGYCMGCFSYQ